MKGKPSAYSAVVICQKCKAPAPTVPGALNVMGDPVFLWHQPCPKCGAEDWVSLLSSR